MEKPEQETSPIHDGVTPADSKRLGLIRERAQRGYYDSDRVIDEVTEAIIEWYDVRRGGKLREDKL
jgi:hypothetical protein